MEKNKIALRVKEQKKIYEKSEWDGEIEGGARETLTQGHC